ncbi:hypothetical protein [Mesorhizobium sp. M2A.F.Ca.ET.039.01.1.1]|uniref:hypothetical protein n=1 Tax=Mesorhizobium sp. M2A.F.Ca.ET.039.01.1.1 TaxID=2496746 RepID=UPI000FCB9DB4|nr:hypothetical protein [Mesorhizobium sp. M2A.F.Ca.ET.039.01.1.1]RWX58039.1 hypothetical protein EOA24_39955 [Mesorhizobium sp. M2A.F.Ca.ET.039.01.1.1]
MQSFATKFALQQDRWKDHSFITLYHLYYQVEGNPPTLIGPAWPQLLADASFADVAGTDRQALLGADPRSSFLGWSTGHKITMHAIASLVAHTTRKSVVLFDEPETHLHANPHPQDGSGQDCIC